MLRFLFCIVELFSMFMTAFLGTLFYLAGFIIAITYKLIRYVYRTLKGGAPNGYVRQHSICIVKRYRDFNVPA